MHVRFRAKHGSRNIAAKRKLRGKSRRKRTTSAMRGNRIGNPWHRKFLKRLSIKKNVNRRRTNTMTALHKHRTAELPMKPGSKLPRMSRIGRAAF